jgi:hypothetical protein
MSSLMLFGFVRHRARPPNVGMIVGSERRNAKHIMMSMGFGGSRATERAPPKTFMLAAPGPVLVAQDTQRACNQFARVGTPSCQARRGFPLANATEAFTAPLSRTPSREGL